MLPILSSFEKIVLLISSVLVVVLPVYVSADEISRPSSVKTLASRVFDFRQDVSVFDQSDNSFFVSEVDWIVNYLLTNAATPFSWFLIEATPQPQSMELWQSANHSYTRTENLPADYVLEAFDTRSAGPSNRLIVLYPTARGSNYFVRCSGAKPALGMDLCSISVIYPPDPRVVLKARLNNPKPPFHFHEIAETMLYVARCLDVTETYSPDKVSVTPPQWGANTDGGKIPGCADLGS